MISVDFASHRQSERANEASEEAECSDGEERGRVPMMAETSGHTPRDNSAHSVSARTGEPAGTSVERDAEQIAHNCGHESNDGASTDVTALVELARAGDHAAFDTLVALHQRPIHIYLAGLVGDDEQARDLAQDVFWRAWNHLFELRQPEHFRAWLFRAATNRARSYLRRRRIVSWVSLEPLRHPAEEPPPGGYQRTASAESLPSVESGFEERLVETDTLRRALRRVPLDYRTSLLLHVSLGFSVREVAEQLGITPGAVRMRLHRGLAALRESYRTENS